MTSPICVLLQMLKNGRWKCPPQTEKEWRSFADLCDFHQTSSFVFCRLKDLPKDAVPSPLLEHMRARFYEISARNHRLARKLVDLTWTFQEHGIPVLAYKGPAVAIAVYGDLSQRQFEDVDLIVRKEHLSTTLDLMTREGYRIVPYSSRCGFHFVPHSIQPQSPKHLRKYHVVTLQAPDQTFFVDLHWKVSNGRTFGPDMEKVWAGATKLKLPQGTICTLSREDLFLALCYHGAKHRWAQLKWLLDIAQLLHEPETLDWSHIQELTADSISKQYVGLAILLASDLLGIPQPEAAKALPITQRTLRVARAIHEEILSQGWANTNHHTTLLDLQESFSAWTNYRFLEYPGWWLEQVFCQVGPKDRMVIRLPTCLDFLYYCVRPIRLLLKYGKRAATALWPAGV
jgi:hypothetical protein